MNTVIRWKYRNTVSQTLPNSVNTTLVFNTMVYNSHPEAWSANSIFTAPRPGMAIITAHLHLQSVAAEHGDDMFLYIVKNGVGLSYFRDPQFNNGSGRQFKIGAMMSLPVIAGDTLSVLGHVDGETGLTRVDLPEYQPTFSGILLPTA